VTGDALPTKRFAKALSNTLDEILLPENFSLMGLDYSDHLISVKLILG
jgi:hypothetical protein